MSAENYSAETNIAPNSGVVNGEGDSCCDKAETVHGESASASRVTDAKVATVNQGPQSLHSVPTVKDESAVSTAATRHQTPLSQLSSC